ncbi:UNVERIFIED_CONTAM: hypothetical protein Sradi_0787700 [Sesamum radiatum]|uniref:Uncharacterized protein n=1 Tax=Sesamum radiatum TaxID=300843 RepID=A0AAW2VQU9_SESRA
MAAPAGYEDPDEWELVNDDGFVYKRKKRPRIDPGGASSAAHPPPDPKLEKKHRRERKKKALLKLREKYLEEISRWELLSNTLKEMEETAEARLLERQELCPTTSFVAASSSEQHSASDTTCQRIVDDLLSQVEAQEAIIRDASNLCDVAEALCSAHEERLKQQLTDLPIWEPSPHELMAALGEQ